MCLKIHVTENLEKNLKLNMTMVGGVRYLVKTHLPFLSMAKLSLNFPKFSWETNECCVILQHLTLR